MTEPVYGQACFWCDFSAILTRDHVVPKSRGGGDGADNVVWACRACNHQRGLLLSFANAAREARETRYWRLVVRLHGKLPGMLAERDRWVATETRKWGRSPTGDLDFTLPPRPSDAEVELHKATGRVMMGKRGVRCVAASAEWLAAQGIGFAEDGRVYSHNLTRAT